MTLSDLIAAAWRFRAVVVLGMIITVSAGLMSIEDRSVYWTRAEVVFLVPQNEYHPNALGESSESVIITAGAVAKSVLGPDRLPKYASPDVSLIGAGIRQGWSITLPDTGGQWSTNFDSQVLMIEAVGPSRQFVLSTADDLRGSIAESLRALQEVESVAPENMITIKASPNVPAIYRVSGSRPRALAMTMLLGGGLTLAAVVVLDARRSRRDEEQMDPQVEAAVAQS
jgi:hypothetical protein